MHRSHPRCCPTVISLSRIPVETANTLVELTPTGQILDTRVVDKSSAQSVFGLVATGTSDSNTALFFTDTHDNDVHELER